MVLLTSSDLRNVEFSFIPTTERTDGLALSLEGLMPSTSPRVLASLTVSGLQAS